jgi:hypothetical protein
MVRMFVSGGEKNPSETSYPPEGPWQNVPEPLKNLLQSSLRPRLRSVAAVAEVGPPGRCNLQQLRFVLLDARVRAGAVGTKFFLTLNCMRRI